MELVIGIIGILLTLWTIKMQFFSKPNEIGIPSLCATKNYHYKSKTI